MSKEIRVSVDTKTILVDVDKLVEFQGNLKDLSAARYEKLKKQIEDHGYSFMVHVWPHEKKLYILDGHQRTRTLKRMRDEEGYKVPKIPVVPVKAKSYKEAKQLVLAGTSQFGEMTEEGLYEFISEAGLDWREVVTDFEFADIDFDHFVGSHFGEETAPSLPPAHEEPEGLVFVIDCDDLDQLNDLQNFFEVTNKKISYQKFKSRVTG